MPGQNPSSTLRIDHEHCRAICEEIGDRLRIVLNREFTPLPPRLLMLLNQLADLERDPGPSIVPSMDHMASPIIPGHIETSFGREAKARSALPV